MMLTNDEIFDMDVLITLPKHLIEKILSGEKTIEMRKTFPKTLRVGIDGFFVVEKKTKNVRCWCRISKMDKHIMMPIFLRKYQPQICVSNEYILRYVPPPKFAHLWFISEVRELFYVTTDDFGVHCNPQSFVYVPNLWWNNKNEI